jgi:SAM-dependent methyltransferase
MPGRSLSDLVACPVHRLPLTADGTGWACSQGHGYRRGEHGFSELAEVGNYVLDVETTSAHCASVQETGGVRVYESYIRPWLRAKGAHTVLDAGCGVGVGVAAMRDDGLAAFGLDVRSVARIWKTEAYDPDAFVVGDVTALPFADNAFDAAVCLGVVEHVGTTTGHLTLAPDYREQRQTLARELERVVRPGGSILLACPNKRFPIDIQHGPNDEQTYARRRTRIFERTGMNLHPTWGDYHLASYGDVRGWFGRHRVRPLPLAGYFGFSALNRPGIVGRMSKAAQVYVDWLPATLRSTALNPYLLVEIQV